MRTQTSQRRYVIKSIEAVKKAIAFSLLGFGAFVLLANTPGKVANAATMVMDFTGVPVPGPSFSSIASSFSQNGITMATTRPLPGGHFDFYGAILTGTLADPVAAIHNGNSGEGVSFTYAGGAFDLLSIDVTGYLIRGAGNSDFLTGTFTSNLGGTHSVTGDKNNLTAGVGVIDFSALGPMWLGISSFTLSVPLGVSTCSDFCDILAFDDVTIADPTVVPIPAALPLFLSGLLGLGIIARRRKKQIEV